MALIPFSEWRPDMPAIGPWSREALNVVPAEESYRPLNSLATASNALTARAQGAAWFRGTAGATKMFASDATKLYLLSGSTWNDVTRLVGIPVQSAPSTATVGGTLAAGTYYYVITALSANGETTRSNEVSQVTTGSTSTVTVNWAVVPNATGYRVYRGTSAGAEDAHIANIVSGATITYIDTGGPGAPATPPVANTATISYAPGADGTWRFTQFGSLAIAVNGVDAPQKFDLAAGTNWEALGGSPPVGTFIATVRDFVVMGKIGSTPQRVQWSGFNNAEAPWIQSAATQADFQDLPDGGNVTGLVGGEYGVIFSETAIRRMSYEGPPTVFRFDKIANDIGCSVPGSVAGLLDMAFCLHKSGFYVVKAGQQVVPIGRGKVDRTFWAEFDEANQHRCSSAIDPVRGLYVFAYPANGSNGTPNRLLIYNWVTQRWSRAVVEVEIVFNGVSQQSVTLEGLDAFGTLETLPYSLDSSFWSGVLSLLLFAFDTAHKSGSFSGTTLEATVETGEFNPGNGRRSIVRGCRPLIDGGSPMVAIGARETQQTSVAYGASSGLTPAGLAPLYSSGRYFRVRAVIPAGGTWNNAQGIDDLDFRSAGAQ